MAHINVSVEYGLHCLIWLAMAGDQPRSGPDLAAFQGISSSFLAKILVKLQRAGIVKSVEGLRGGYLLARDPEEITLLEVVDAIEGRKALFDCQDIRQRCALFGSAPPRWATEGVCPIHARMLKAEKAMRSALQSETVADIARSASRTVPSTFADPTRSWFDDRAAARGIRKGRTSTLQDQPDGN